MAVRHLHTSWDPRPSADLHVSEAGSRHSVSCFLYRVSRHQQRGHQQLLERAAATLPHQLEGQTIFSGSR